MPGTVRLGIYPIRMITARGRAWAANWEVRQGAVYSRWGSPQAIFRADFCRPGGWKLSDAATTATEPEPGGLATVGRAGGATACLVMRPPPLAVATAVQRSFIPVKAGTLYAFRLAMQNDASPQYDRTHDTWVSCYLEFFDAEHQFLDYVKAMAFRPVLERPVGAAMRAPAGARFARFRLVASHITYADRKRITGTMTARFGRLQLERSSYDPTWSRRPGGDTLRFDRPVQAARVQIRTVLLTRDPRVAPSFAGYRVTVQGR